MAIIGVPNLKATGVAEDTTRPKRWRDAILKDVPNDGVRFGFDLAFPFSYPGGAPTSRPAAGAPADNQLIADMTERADGFAGVGTTYPGSLTYAGGGFDFSADQSSNATKNRGVIAPASALADLWTAYGGASQRFLIWDYLKLPSKANWNTSASILTMLGDENYTTTPSLIILAQANGNVLQSRRQTAANAQVSLALTPDDSAFGTVCQVAMWRNAAGTGLRLRSLTGGAAAQVATGAVGSDNTQDFSANTFCFGRNPRSFPGGGGGVVLTAMSGVRQYRGFIENLARSGRDPVTVLDADFLRQQARNAFS